MNTLGADAAIACFKEAASQTSTATNPAQWNIANGLANLAYAIKQMEAEIAALRTEIRAQSQK
jgi:hypothetical protein